MSPKDVPPNCVSNGASSGPQAKRRLAAWLDQDDLELGALVL
jgi:hypothetical protein